jgi:hypothetical protein
MRPYFLDRQRTATERGKRYTANILSPLFAEKRWARDVLELAEKAENVYYVCQTPRSIVWYIDTGRKMSFFDRLKKATGAALNAAMTAAESSSQQNAPQSSGKFAYATAGKEPNRDADGRAIVTAATGSDIELDIREFGHVTSHYGRPKADGEEFSRTVKLYLLQAESSKGEPIVKVFLPNGDYIGEIAYKDNELACEIMSAVRNLIASQDVELERAGFVLQVSAKLSGDWSEDEDEGHTTKEANVDEFFVRLKNPLQLEIE